MIQHKPDCKPGLRFEQYIMPVVGSKCLYCLAEEITKHVSSIDWQSRHARLIERLEGLVGESRFMTCAHEFRDQLQQIIYEAKK
jgi:hypothetical protein